MIGYKKCLLITLVGVSYFCANAYAMDHDDSKDRPSSPAQQPNLDSSNNKAEVELYEGETISHIRLIRNARDRADKLQHCMRAFHSMNKVFELKGEQATANDFDRMAVICSLIGLNSNTPTDQFKYYFHAVQHSKTVLAKKGKDATVNDYTMAASYNYCTSTKTKNPKLKFEYSVRAMLLSEKVLELKGDQATAKDFNHATVHTFTAAMEAKANSIRPNKLFSIAANYSIRVIEKKGNEATAQDFFTAANRCQFASNEAPTPNEQFMYFLHSCHLYHNFLQKKGESAAQEDFNAVAVALGRMVRQSLIKDRPKQHRIAKPCGSAFRKY